MFNPSLVNSRFKLFQRRTKRFSGLNYNDVLPLNIYFCQSHSNFYLSSRHIELMVRYLKRKLKKSGTLVFPIPAVYPITKKPTEVRMGKGKGAPEYWIAQVKPGTILFEADGVSMEIAKEAMRLAAQKLPVTTKFVVRRDYSAA